MFCYKSKAKYASKVLKNERPILKLEGFGSFAFGNFSLSPLIPALKFFLKSFIIVAAARQVVVLAVPKML